MYIASREGGGGVLTFFWPISIAVSTRKSSRER